MDASKTTTYVTQAQPEAVYVSLSFIRQKSFVHFIDNEPIRGLLMVIEY